MITLWEKDAHAVWFRGQDFVLIVSVHDHCLYFHSFIQVTRITDTDQKHHFKRLNL